MTESSDIVIKQRDIRFDLSDVDFGAWHPVSLHLSHYFNVQSLLFPQGERFFIRSVRNFRDQIRNPTLQQQVKGFVGQEAMHGREHQAYNQGLADIGYRVEETDAYLAKSFSLAEKFLSKKMLLAMTVGLEHLTAIGAEDTLSDADLFADAHPEMARLWRWHALEETEHKAVAFDVYKEVAGSSPLAWLRRCFALVFVSLSMQFIVWLGLLRVLGRSGLIFDRKNWLDFLRALWISPGFIRHEIPRYFEYFKPSFHPWDRDNYHHIQRWEAEYSEG